MLMHSSLLLSSVTVIYRYALSDAAYVQVAFYVPTTVHGDQSAVAFAPSF